MKTVSEVSRLTGVSVRTLHHYDEIGLLHPAQVTEAGYRLYGEKELEKLQMILFFRELKFPLRDVKRILESADFDRNRALEQQIELLEMQRDHIETLITFARGIQMTGVKYMDFSAFDTRKLDDYAAQAKAAWGKTDAWREYEERDRQFTKEDRKAQEDEMMALMRRFGEMRHLSPEGEEAQALVQELRDFITANFYTCTVPILRGLGRMYDGGGAITERLDETGGPGTASFAAQAIEVYSRRVEK